MQFSQKAQYYVKVFFNKAEQIKFVCTIIVVTIEEQIKTKELPLARKLSINIIYTANWVNELIGEALKPFDVSLQQFNVLRILRGQKGKPANLSTIQDRMVSKMSNTTRLVDKLIGKELVNRNTCPTNRRKVDITITTLGLSLLDTIDPIIKDVEEQITKNTKTYELEQLNNMLNNLRNK